MSVVRSSGLDRMLMKSKRLLVKSFTQSDSSVDFSRQDALSMSRTCNQVARRIFTCLSRRCPDFPAFDQPSREPHTNPKTRSVVQSPYNELHRKDIRKLSFWRPEWLFDCFSSRSGGHSTESMPSRCGLVDDLAETFLAKRLAL